MFEGNNSKLWKSALPSILLMMPPLNSRVCALHLVQCQVQNKDNTNDDNTMTLNEELSFERTYE